MIETLMFENTMRPRVLINGIEYGDGKIVLLGEAAMITAQLAGNQKAGMNSPEAPENGQLALNIFRYLSTD